jgi:hypothetical protein
MKAVLFSLLVITSIFFIIPSAYANHSIETCANEPTMEERKDCAIKAQEQHDEVRLDHTSRAAETYNMQFLALGGIVVICVAVGIVVIKFVILKK